MLDVNIVFPLMLTEGRTELRFSRNLNHVMLSFAKIAFIESLVAFRVQPTETQPVPTHMLREAD